MSRDLPPTWPSGWAGGFPSVKLTDVCQGSLPTKFEGSLLHLLVLETHLTHSWRMGCRTSLSDGVSSLSFLGPLGPVTLIRLVSLQILFSFSSPLVAPLPSWGLGGRLQGSLFFFSSSFAFCHLLISEDLLFVESHPPWWLLGSSFPTWAPCGKTLATHGGSSALTRPAAVSLFAGLLQSCSQLDCPQFHLRSYLALLLSCDGGIHCWDQLLVFRRGPTSFLEARFQRFEALNEKIAAFCQLSLQEVIECCPYGQHFSVGPETDLWEGVLVQHHLWYVRHHLPSTPPLSLLEGIFSLRQELSHLQQALLEQMPGFLFRDLHQVAPPSRSFLKKRIASLRRPVLSFIGAGPILQPLLLIPASLFPTPPPGSSVFPVVFPAFLSIFRLLTKESPHSTPFTSAPTTWWSSSRVFPAWSLPCWRVWRQRRDPSLR